MDAGATTLVVDCFDRVLPTGSYHGLGHDFAARVGAAVGGAATVSHRALVEAGFALAPFAAVIWLCGDESTEDLTFHAAERALVLDYLDAGGGLVASGSEIAWELGTVDAAFLADAFGAAYAGDDSGSYAVAGAGALAAVASFAYAGAGSAYDEDFPDFLATAPGGEVLLEYATGTPAAVGLPGRGALVGFPLELVDSDAALAEVLGPLLDYVTL
jgi:hypothetical protein